MGKDRLMPELTDLLRELDDPEALERPPDWWIRFFDYL